MISSVFIASDHGGIERKKEVIAHLESRGIECVDFGAVEGEAVDYPDKAFLVCDALKKTDSNHFGIVLCGTGIGISIAANKIEGIRCALINDVFTATVSKEHNNANVIALGGRVELPDGVPAILDAYIDASFEGGRHQRRVDKMMALEKK